MLQTRLVLGSASPRRRELLATLGLPFDVREPNIDEPAMVGHSAEPQALAAELASAKSAAIDASADEVVLTADTVVWLDGRVFGKPANEHDARAMLRELRGRDHRVTTAIVGRRADDRRSDQTTSRVFMRWYGEGEIDRYIARGEPFDKAGAYAIQDTEFAPVVSLRGCHCAVMGLPLWKTERLLDAFGLRPAAPSLPQCAGCPDRSASAPAR